MLNEIFSRRVMGDGREEVCLKWGSLDRVLARLGLPEEIDLLWSALRCSLNRTWFTRLWIVQEVILVRHITVLCGSKRVEWNALTGLRSPLKKAEISDLPWYPETYFPNDALCVNENTATLRGNTKQIITSNFLPQYNRDGRDTSLNLWIESTDS